jgi:hypothetical protein
MLASGPIRTDPRTGASEIVESVRELVAEAKDSRTVFVSRPGLSVELRSDGR